MTNDGGIAGPGMLEQAILATIRSIVESIQPMVVGEVLGMKVVVDPLMEPGTWKLVKP